MYQKIINPINNEVYNINTNKGKQLLKQYVNYYVSLNGGMKYLRQFGNTIGRLFKTKKMNPSKSISDKPKIAYSNSRTRSSKIPSQKLRLTEWAWINERLVPVGYKKREEVLSKDSIKENRREKKMNQLI